MAQTELERVQTDLAAMKAICVEPAIPTEEIVPNLILALSGVLLTVAVFLAPLIWVGRVVGLLAVLAMAVYIPWKRRVFRKDYPRRRLEAKEAWVQIIGGVAIVSYVVWFRFAVSDSRESIKLMFPGVLFLLGIAITAYCIVEQLRMYYLGTGIAMTVGAVLVNFAAGPTSFSAILFGTWIASGLSNAICLWWAARRERSEHGGN